MANLFRNYPPVPSVTYAEEYVAPAGTLAKDVIVSIAGVGRVLPLRGTLAKDVIVSIAGVGKIPVEGTLDKTVLTSITAAGNVQPKKGTLAKDVLVSIASAGSVTKHGTLAQDVLVGIAAAGTVPYKGVLVKDVLVNLATIGTVYFIRTNTNFPALTISAQNNNLPPNVNAIPALTSSATMLNGSVINANASFPAFTINIDLGHDTSASIPALTISSTMAAGRILTTNTKIASLTGSATLEQAGTATANLITPSLKISATMTSAGYIQSADSLPTFKMDATVISGGVSTVAQTVPAFTISSFMAEQAVGSLVASLPTFYSLGIMNNGAPATFNPFTMNTENYGVTQYENYDFHTVFRRDGNYYGASTTGIYLLSGGDDDGTDITAGFKLGFDDFNDTGLKRVPYVYLGYTSDGDMNVDVSIDGEPAVRQYLVGQISHTSGIKRGRAKPGRGLKSRYWQFGASNIDGADFEVDTIGFYIQQFNRKAQ